MIAANTNGVEIVRSDNLVQNNWIGTDASGTLDLGHAGPGVFINGGSGTQVLENVIAFNGVSAGGTGVAVSFRAAGNAIVSNSIYSNEGLGIDLNDDGVTPTMKAIRMPARTTCKTIRSCSRQSAVLRQPWSPEHSTACPMNRS